MARLQRPKRQKQPLPLNWTATSPGSTGKVRKATLRSASSRRFAAVKGARFARPNLRLQRRIRQTLDYTRILRADVQGPWCSKTGQIQARPLNANQDGAAVVVRSLPICQHHDRGRTQGVEADISRLQPGMSAITFPPWPQPQRRWEGTCGRFCRTPRSSTRCAVQRGSLMYPTKCATSCRR